MSLQYIIDGLSVGAVYALIALSYSLIFGVIRIVNFAQGELITLGCMGALGGWTLGTNFRAPVRIGLMLVGAGLASCGAALAMERLVFRPLLKRRSPALLGLIGSLGVSIFVQNALRLSISSSDLVFPRLVSARPIEVLEIQIMPSQIMVIITTLILGALTVMFVKTTKTGSRIIAVRDNRALAEAFGIAAADVLRRVFFISSLLAAIGGLMMGLYYGVARYDMGFLPGIKGFTACIMGGLGNVRGAMLAGLALGIVESLGAAYVSSGYRDAFAFVFLVLVLLFRPHGLLGEGKSL